MHKEEGKWERKPSAARLKIRQSAASGLADLEVYERSDGSKWIGQRSFEISASRLATLRCIVFHTARSARFGSASPTDTLSATLDMLWLLLLLLDIIVRSHGTLRGVGMSVDEHCDERRSRSSFLHSSSTLPPLQHSIPRRSHTAMVSNCSDFMNWSENRRASQKENAVIFRSLVARVKLQLALDASLETKAVKFLESVDTNSRSQVITAATMKMLETLNWLCSDKVKFALVKADLIPQLIITLNPQSLSFAKAVDIHVIIMATITNLLWLSTPDGLTRLEIEDRDEQQAVHETVLKQIVVPSEKYICHLCVNRYLIINGDQSHCLTYYDFDYSSWTFLYHMNFAQQGWNTKGGETRQMWKNVRRMLRMEGIEDVIEEKLRNDKNSFFGREIVVKSIGWNNLQGMNLPERS
ncbi:hypothetical protein BLNAU_18119 [Blattamonas nauphoetae]|uniref:Uncharacterized protein n=1 Tax=Blattamonas nauphoetae TaxID=2049346 RepID=A0ABQ9X9L4_9EUKA|nr:hypothetical protein BLNAU_18119 [Blattamonas nauphoetae]